MIVSIGMSTGLFDVFQSNIDLIVAICRNRIFYVKMQTLFESSSMLSGHQMRDAPAQYHPSSVTNPKSRRVWRIARERGVCLVATAPITTTAATATSSLAG